jgi:hypothetical protein
MIEFVSRIAQTGRDHCILKEDGQPALTRGFLP